MTAFVRDRPQVSLVQCCNLDIGDASRKRCSFGTFRAQQRSDFTDLCGRQHFNWRMLLRLLDTCSEFFTVARQSNGHQSAPG